MGMGLRYQGGLVLHFRRHHRRQLVPRVVVEVEHLVIISLIQRARPE